MTLLRHDVMAVWLFAVKELDVIEVERRDAFVQHRLRQAGIMVGVTNPAFRPVGH